MKIMFKINEMHVMKMFDLVKVRSLKIIQQVTHE